MNGVHHAQDGKTALMFAIERGHVHCARLLLDVGADIEASDKVRASRFLRSFLRSRPCLFEFYICNFE